MADILVKHLMTKPVYTIDIKKTIRDAAIIMDKYSVGSVVVMKNGKPVGILSDTDIIRRVVANNAKPSSIPIEKVMSSPLITIDPNESYLEASKKLKKNNIKRLPVVTKTGKLVGMLSLTDIAASVPEMLDLLQYRIKLREEEPVIKEEFTSGICERCEAYTMHLKYKNNQWLCETCIDELDSEE